MRTTISEILVRTPAAEGSSRQSGEAAISILAEEDFHRSLRLERKRSQRSGKPFLLVLVDIGPPVGRSGKHTLPHTMKALSQGTRDTDLVGWYEQDSVIGIMFTEIGHSLTKPVLATMLLRVSGALHGRLSLEEFGRLSISFQLFPDDGGLAEFPGDERFRFLSRFAV